jgi:hypothetical protein
MKNFLLLGFSFVVLTGAGCTDREAQARKAREEAETKARAEASRKEMETLPKTFRSRDVFKQNEAEKKTDGAAAPSKKTP